MSACLREANASHSHKMWAEVSSAVPLPVSGVMVQPHYKEMFSQGVLSGKETNNGPGLCPIKGQ